MREASRTWARLAAGAAAAVLAAYPGLAGAGAPRCEPETLPAEPAEILVSAQLGPSPAPAGAPACTARHGRVLRGAWGVLVEASTLQDGVPFHTGRNAEPGLMGHLVLPSGQGTAPSPPTGPPPVLPRPEASPCPVEPPGLPPPPDEHTGLDSPAPDLPYEGLARPGTAGAPPTGRQDEGPPVPTQAEERYVAASLLLLVSSLHVRRAARRLAAEG